MAELDTALAELEGALNNPAGEGKSGPELVKFIIESRAKTIKNIGEVVRTAATDPRLKANPDFRREFDERFTALRRGAAAIQAKYRADHIEQDLANYARQSRATSQGLTDFCRWARASL
jgi:site-specific recombinase